MREFLTVEDIRRHSGWREEEEERQAERRKRELVETEKQQQARKSREEAKQQAASNNWYAAVDGRFNEHLKNWLWNAIDERIREHIEQWWEHALKDGIGDAMGTIGKRVRDEFKCADEEQQRAFEAKLAVLEEHLIVARLKLPCVVPTWT